MFISLLITPAMASSAVASAGGFSQQLYQYLPLVLIFVAFYFFLIRPQQKKAQEQRNMLSALSKGDKIITSGGLIGTVARIINEQEVVVEIADGVKVLVVRSMITQNLSKGNAAADTSPKSLAQSKGSNVKSLAEAKKKTTRKTATPTKRRTTKK